jgi:hypothetical protein
MDRKSQVMHGTLQMTARESYSCMKMSRTRVQMSDRGSRSGYNQTHQLPSFTILEETLRQYQGAYHGLRIFEDGTRPKHNSTTQNIGTQNVPVQTQRQPLSKKQKAAEAGKNLGFVSMLAS